MNNVKHKLLISIDVHLFIIWFEFTGRHFTHIFMLVFLEIEGSFSFHKTGGKKSFKYIFWKCVQIFAYLNIACLNIQFG